MRIQAQERSPTPQKLLTWAESEMASNMTLFDGSNTGMTLFVLGPSSDGLVVSWFGLFGVLVVVAVDGGCVMFALVVRFTTEVLRLVVAVPSVISFSDVGADVVVGIIAPSIGCTKMRTKGGNN